MATVSQQYLKDKNGNIFSPITSTKSIYKGTEDLETVLDKLLYYQPKETVTYESFTTLGTFTQANMMFLSFSLLKSLEKVKSKITISAEKVTLIHTTGEIVRKSSTTGITFASDSACSHNQLYAHCVFNSNIHSNFSTNRLVWVELDNVKFIF